MRLPDTVSVARRWILAGGAAALVVLALLVLDQLRMRPPETADRPGTAVLTQAPSWTPAATRDAAPASPGAAAPARDPAAGVPEGLQVPTLGIDADVHPVALAPEGLLVPPADPADVGWWNEGAKPGTPRGTVLLAGHSVRLGEGVFDDLDHLEEGDLVRVVTARGVVSYRVQDVLSLTTQELAELSPRLFSQSAAGRLVLVTCADWAAGDYRGNTVVVAKP